MAIDPIEQSRRWAYEQRAYERDVAESRVSKGGQLEQAASQAVGAMTTQPVPEQLEALFETNRGITIAYITPLPSRAGRRRRGLSGTPSLGSLSKRRSDIQKIETFVEHLPEDLKRDAGSRGMAVVAMIQRTVDDDELRRQVQAFQGSLLQA